MIAAKSNQITNKAIGIATIQEPCHKFKIIGASAVAGSGNPKRKALSCASWLQALSVRAETATAKAPIRRTLRNPFAKLETK